jgi:hypothetical protein
MPVNRVASNIVGTLIATILASAPAFGQTQEACLWSYDQAQRLRDRGKLIETRERLLVCAQDVCPELARKDCERWLREVDASTPSVVVRARDPDGRDAVDVQVWVDGAPFLRNLDGRARSLDPGVHFLRYEMTGGKAIQERIVVVEGEKNRLLMVDFARDRGDATPAPVRGPSRPAAAYLFAGIGVVGIAGFAYFASTGLSERSDLQRTCYPGCSAEEVDRARSKLVIGDISLVVGLASAGVATWLFVRPGPTTSTSFGIVPVTGGSMATVRGMF